MDTIIVTGVGGPAGRAASTFFRSRGFRVLGTDSRVVPAEVDEFALVPRADDPQFMNRMLRLICWEQPFLFIPTVTEELPIAALLKPTLRALGVRVFIPDPDVVCTANDKFMTARFLESRLIPVPRTLCDDEVGDALEAGERLGYPLVVKPRCGRGGRGVVVYFEPEAAAEEHRKNVVYQEFLGGEEYDANLFVYPTGEPAVVRILLKTRLRQGIVGNAESVRLLEQRDVSELAIDTARVMRLEGPVDMDIRRTEHGDPRILEVNVRVGANVLEAQGVLDRLFEQSIT